MHVRSSMCNGTAVVDDRSDELLGEVSGVFVHPDVGRIEGVFVRTHMGEEFLASADIAHWGRHIVVRHDDCLAPLEERVRLSALWDEGRTVLGQIIVTEGGETIGRCSDLQFETDTFRLEWLFPRRWWRWKRPVPVGAIVEVRPDAICIRDQAIPTKETTATNAAAALDAIRSAQAQEG